MAVNHADGQLFLSVPVHAIAAGVGAAQAGAGWLTLFFVPAGLATGIGMCWCGRRIVYSVLGLGLNRTSQIHNRTLQTFALFPFLTLYMALPMVIAWGGVIAVWAGSGWLVKQIL